MDQTMDRAGNFLPRVDESALRPQEVDRRVVSLTAPASVAAEQYRTLYYRLERMREMRPMKIIAVASARPGEGKTLTTVNLALTAARANGERRIVLVDADLRRGQAATLLGVKSKPGLAELLAGEGEVRQAVRRFKSTSLALIPAGHVPDEPTSLLAGKRMKRMLAKLRECFDEIYIDLPPILPFADCSILAPQSDGVVLVIRANTTPHRQISQALEQLAGAPMIGCVLNGSELTTTPYLKSYLK